MGLANKTIVSKMSHFLKIYILLILILKKVLN
nr:MAG TPA: hypothetical protein [Caudoviricetes sp.]